MALPLRIIARQGIRSILTETLRTLRAHSLRHLGRNLAMALAMPDDAIRAAFDAATAQEEADHVAAIQLIRAELARPGIALLPRQLNERQFTAIAPQKRPFRSPPK
ncbi:hypothetical protein [Sphingomonas sp. PAMC 26617]|uniref:hypothetical protein n=1 Tax=Sphingomonas sp. PAMC 26617 TaxID=1112216 RepID=UPI000288779B|nr:hypothetical protein [Sphingomonas sp. PAMC 26617]